MSNKNHSTYGPWNHYGHDFDRQRYALFGQPVDNSYSSHIYRQLFDLNNVAAKYTAINTDSAADIPYFIKEFGLSGCNVTSPLKKSAMDICHTVTEDAQTIGGVNTIVCKGANLLGFNTDWEGVLYAINQITARFPHMQINPAEANILVIGAGPAAAAAVFAIRKLYPAAGISIANRTTSHAMQLAAQFDCKWLDMDKISAAMIMDFDIIIIASANRSSKAVTYSIPQFYTRLPVDRMGQASWAEELPPELKNRPPEWEHTVYRKIGDSCGKKPGTSAIIYANYSNQKYFTAARQSGISALSGVQWLQGQALAAFEYFIGREDFCPNTELLDDYIDKKLREESEANILLTGFSGSGKTAAAPLIAQKTGRTWVDTDAVIQHMVGEQIEDLLTHVSEERFREIEAAVIRQYASVPNSVIATGAGAMCNPKNQQTVQYFNCRVIYMYSDLATCMSRITDITTRPYLNGKSDRELEALYQARKLIYFDNADVIQRSDKWDSF